jgi:ribosomal protein L32
MFRLLQRFSDSLLQRFSFAFQKQFVLQPQLAGFAVPQAEMPSLFDEALWFAVPKKKVTRHKKRLKTTVQKRLKRRTDIVFDGRTGQITLMHKMPFNWRDYLTDPNK